MKIKDMYEVSVMCNLTEQTLENGICCEPSELHSVLSKLNDKYFGVKVDGTSFVVNLIGVRTSAQEAADIGVGESGWDSYIDGVSDLMEELEGIKELMEDGGCPTEIYEQLVAQSGTIQTIVNELRDQC